MPGQSHFGEFVFEHDKGLLLRRGEVIRLQAQPARVLAELLSCTDRVVTREELKCALWGHNTYVDFEKGLNFCIGQIRAALQDNASRPLYIRTVPKQGYQFIAPIRYQVAEDKPSIPVLPVAHVVRSRRWPRIVALAASIGLVASIALYRWTHLPVKIPNVAVVRFDMEPTVEGLPGMGDVLTDDVVVQLAEQSKDRYRVIGNANILRQPRDRRDLRAIGATLNSPYVVLGQIRVAGDHVLVLAHLIRVSDQTHISVSRTEATLGDRSTFEASTARRIASQFAAAMTNKPDEAPSFQFAAR